MANSNHRTQVIVAVIGLAGGLGTAGIANLPQLSEVFGISLPQQHQAGGVGRSNPDGEGGVAVGSRSAPDATPRPLAESPAAPPVQSEQRKVFGLRATIDDPDGYTNVRSRGSVSGAVIDRIAEGEEFRTYIQEDNWWQIKTSRGKVGYIHVSRIRLL